MVVRANTEVAKMARGVGKTLGIISPRMAHNAFAMKRSLGGLVAPSYKKFFTELVPSIFSGLDRLGYVEGKHYVIGRRGNKRWEQPYNRVFDWDHAMHWCCGSGRAFISQDRPGMGNGLSFDDLIVEEAKLINAQRFYDSTRPAMRGNTQYFGGMSEHHSLLIVSDAGSSPSTRWWESYAEQMDEEVITMILQCAYRQQQLIESIRKGNLSTNSHKRYIQEIATLDKDLNELRKDAVYYHTASALDNIDLIGWENFLKMEKTMSPILFGRSMMNETADSIEGAWYHGFDESKHTYTPKATSWTVARGYNRDRLAVKDARHDAEILSNLPIDIAFDYGGRFNCMAIGQSFSDLYRIDNGLHATHPDTITDVVMAFVQYYLHHQNKQVNYFYDKTARDKHGTTRFTYEDIVLNTLRDNGWHVNPVYFGRVPEPKSRYELTVHLLGQPTPPVQWNPDNCSDMIMSMCQTQIREGRNGMEKDKRPESGPLEEQIHAPHYGDAVDTLLWGRFQVMEQASGQPAFSPPGT